MARVQRWEVTGYSITLNGSRGFGWIQLTSGPDDAGYIYFRDDPPADGVFRGNPAQPYIVMSQPVSHWNFILDILRNEKPLYIYGSQAADDQPVKVAFGNSDVEPVGEGE